MNNYRVDIFFRDNHYMVEFPEYWLAKTYARAVSNEKDVVCIFMLERITDTAFEITERIK